MVVDLAVEDYLSEAVLKQLIAWSGRKFKVGVRYPVSAAKWKQKHPTGYGELKKNILALNKLAEHKPLILLTDLDTAACPSELISTWLGNCKRQPRFIFRVAVREIEAWLLADKDSLANFLSAPVRIIPGNVERLADPKHEIIRIASLSKSSEIRNGLVPAPKTTARVGPYYNTLLIQFAKHHWNPTDARKNSPSLDKAMNSIDNM